MGRCALVVSFTQDLKRYCLENLEAKLKRLQMNPKQNAAQIVATQTKIAWLKKKNGKERVEVEI